MRADMPVNGVPQYVSNEEEAIVLGAPIYQTAVTVTPSLSVWGTFASDVKRGVLQFCNSSFSPTRNPVFSAIFPLYLTA